MIAPHHLGANADLEWRDPLKAIVAEFERHGTDEDKMIVDYVVNQKAGSCETEFPNGGTMDQGRAADWRLQGHIEHRLAMKLKPRAAYKSINDALRARIDASGRAEPYPFPWPGDRDPRARAIDEHGAARMKADGRLLAPMSTTA